MISMQEVGLLRVRDIVGDKKKGIPAILPISKASWWNGVRSGKYPKPKKLGPRTTVWTVEEIRQLIEHGVTQEASHG